MSSARRHAPPLGINQVAIVLGYALSRNLPRLLDRRAQYSRGVRRQRRFIRDRKAQVEPTTVVTKAWEQVIAVGHRAYWEPRTVLVTGAGPIGLLAALVGKQRGLDVHVLDRVESGPKPELVRALGATYHTGNVQGVGFEPDVIVECTGVGQVNADSIQALGAGGIVCLTGVGSGGRTTSLSTADVAAEMVLRNNVVVGSVNANKRHWYKAGQVLARADRAWLGRLVTRRERPEDFAQALERRNDDIKVVVQFAEA